MRFFRHLCCSERCAGGCPAASHFLLLRQKKVTKEKATLLLRPSLRYGFPALLACPGRLRNSAPAGPQTVLADIPPARLRCSAQQKGGRSKPIGHHGRRKQSITDARHPFP